MCGIVGFTGINRPRGQLLSLLKSMTDSLKHRGPDDEGYLLADTSTGQTVALGGPDTPLAVFGHDALYCPRQTFAEQARGGRFNLALGHRRLAIIDLSPTG